MKASFIFESTTTTDHREVLFSKTDNVFETLFSNVDNRVMNCTNCQKIDRWRCA